MNLECQRHLFELNEDAIYLNGAYMSPILKSVEQSGIEGIKKKRNPSSYMVSDFFDETVKAQQLFGQLLNIDDTERICIVPSASYGLANAAKNITVNRGESICVLGDQFPSNYYTWERLAHKNGGMIKSVPAPLTTERRGEKWNNDFLRAITTDVKVVAMSHVHWTDGTLFNLKSIRNKCDEVGAYLIIDGTQSFGALQYDQQEIRADALVAASYKWMFGPYSIGIAYYNEKFDHGEPIEESWINRLNSGDFKNLVSYQNNYRTGAQRYGVGESSNFILLPMLNTALTQLTEWQPHRFQKYCQRISSSFLSEIRKYGFWVEDEDYRSGHIFGVKIPEGMDINIIKSYLESKNISVSFRGANIRVSPSIYNTQDDLQIFAKCLSNTVESKLDFSQMS